MNLSAVKSSVLAEPRSLMLDVEFYENLKETDVFCRVSFALCIKGLLFSKLLNFAFSRNSLPRLKLC